MGLVNLPFHRDVLTSKFGLGFLMHGNQIGIFGDIRRKLVMESGSIIKELPSALLAVSPTIALHGELVSPPRDSDNDGKSNQWEIWKISFQFWTPPFAL